MTRNRHVLLTIVKLLYPKRKCTLAVVKVDLYLRSLNEPKYYVFTNHLHR